MDKAELENILRLHKDWLVDTSKGIRAELPEIDLVGHDLTAANLREALLMKVNLSGANLSAANLQEAILMKANLSGANLLRANLHSANLSRANLHMADLYGADLRRSNLLGADLSEAYLPNANLTGAIGVVCAGTDRRGYRFIGVKHEDGWRVAAGCRWFTISEAIEHWTKKDNKDALSRVNTIIANGRD